MLSINNFKIIKNKSKLKSQSIDKKIFIYAKKNK